MTSKNPIYRRSKRDSRRIVESGSFGKGMYYTNNLLDGSTSRLILNYILRDNGSYISPRNGIVMERNLLVKEYNRPFTPDSTIPGPHVRYYGVYRDSDGLDKFGTILLSFGVPNDPDFKYYFTDSKNLKPSYYDQVYTNNGSAFGFIEDFDGDFEPIDVSALKDTRLKFYKDTPKPLYTVFNNELYVIDGKADSTSKYEDYRTTGSFLRYSEFPYSGKFNQLVIKAKDDDVDELRVVTHGSDNVLNGEIIIPVTLRTMQNINLYDEFRLIPGVVYQKINELIPDVYLQGAELDPDAKTVTLLKIKKPEDSYAFDRTDETVSLKTTFGTFTENGIIDKDVLDNVNNINTFSSRMSKTHYYMVLPSGLTLDDISELYEIFKLRYALSTPVEYPVDTSMTLQVEKNGYILFDIPSNRMPVTADFDITYKQPISTYSGGLLKLTIVKEKDKFVLRSTPVTAKPITISEATSVGFNMLHPNPYSFQNNKGNVLRPLGIMPYIPGSNQDINMSANIGGDVEFEVIYEYVQGAKYFVKWEYLAISDNMVNVSPVLIEDYGATVNAGSRITKVIKANDKKFSIRVTIAPPNKDNKPDATLAKVVTYPIYTAGNSYLKDISSVKYNLHNARGLGVYRTMLCLWGVPGAETTLFFSDIDDVSYFPFSNNIISFDHKILGVQKYQESLLVFTTGSIYLVTGEKAEKFDVVEMYQNLTFTDEDMESLLVIKNMIFIRSGNSYYTLVPNTFTGNTSDVKLSNISGPIKEITTDWDSFLKFLGDEVFDYQISWGVKTEIVEYDFFNYIDDSKVKNVYRFGIYEYSDTGALYRYQIDVVLVFDTNKGTWSVETMNLPFNEVVATSKGIHSSYGRSFGNKTKLYYQELDYKNSSRIDIYNSVFYREAVNDRITSVREEELQKLPDVVEDEILYVIDGDTVMLKTLGSFRFLYCNAPEDTTKIEPFGPETTAFMKELLPVGTKVRIEFEGDRSDKYERTMGWIFKGDTLVQNELAKFGGVVSVYDFGAVRYKDELDELIEKAWLDKIGVWQFDKGKPRYIHATDSVNTIPNYQVFDTGNKNHDPYVLKRFSEFQFQVINKSSDNLEFYNRFFVESVPRQDFRDYEITQDLDPQSLDYGTINVVPVDDYNLEIAAVTHLNTWKLDTSKLPPLDVLKVRFRVSGKGRYGRMLMISKNEANYELLSYAWVIRFMNYK